jgi:hypothetical protein
MFREEKKRGVPVAADASSSGTSLSPFAYALAMRALLGISQYKVTLLLLLFRRLCFECNVPQNNFLSAAELP